MKNGRLVLSWFAAIFLPLAARAAEPKLVIPEPDAVRLPATEATISSPAATVLAPEVAAPGPASSLPAPEANLVAPQPTEAGLAAILAEPEAAVPGPQMGSFDNLGPELAVGSPGEEDCGCDCCDTRLFGFFRPSDHGFDDFISPMTNPVYFEDPRTLTEARLIFLDQEVPAKLGGGDVKLTALQLRAAITDRLSFIATKDGYITSSNPLVEDGWSDVSAGLKFNVFKNCEDQRIVSVGATYDMPIGSPQSLQGGKGGSFDLFVTSGIEINGWHFISTSGIILPSDTNTQSQFSFWSTHFDHRIGCSKLYMLSEFNWYHYLTSGGNTATTGVMGGDLFNLGSAGIAGRDFVTGAFGLKYKPNQHVEMGVDWELPLSSNHDLMTNRLTADFIIRF
jgi:hypothetical protein